MLAEADVDLIFNIAEGVAGRNREAQVPALCELLGIPYTGSRLGDAGDRARQGARQEGAAAARHPDAEVPGDGVARASGCRRT